MTKNIGISYKQLKISLWDDGKEGQPCILRPNSARVDFASCTVRQDLGESPLPAERMELGSQGLWKARCQIEVSFAFDQDKKHAKKNLPTHFTGGIAVLTPVSLVTADQVGPSN